MILSLQVLSLHADRAGGTARTTAEGHGRRMHRIPPLIPPSAQPKDSLMSRLFTWKAAALAVLFAWAFWPTLTDLFLRWMNDPQYSHGILVPFFSLYLLSRRWPAEGITLNPAPVLGFTVLGLAVLCRAVGTTFDWFDPASILVTLVGIALVCGGKPALRWSWPAILFLLFMVPLPYQMEHMLSGPLRLIATEGSTFCLQTLGQPAISEGNAVLIRETRLEVVEACSGLRMLVTFAAFCTGAVILMQRHWIEKGLVLLSALPIALATNIIRITTTGLAYVMFGTESRVVEVLHDLYGWLMMPIGLTLLMLELWLFRHLLIEPQKTMR